MSKERQFIKEVCDRMKIGQRINVDADLFAIAFPCGFPSIYETHEQAFLSSMIGSAWGAWRVDRDFENHYIIISRHKMGNERIYIDPDRAHLFKRLSDGTLELRNQNEKSPSK